MKTLELTRAKNPNINLRTTEHIGRVLSKEADSVFEDGIAVNHWWRLFAEREMVIL